MCITSLLLIGEIQLIASELDIDNSLTNRYASKCTGSEHCIFTFKFAF